MERPGSGDACDEYIGEAYDACQTWDHVFNLGLDLGKFLA